MHPTDITIRREMPGDEGAIDAVNCRAFGQMDEAHLVRLIRSYYPAFDHRYSLTAWYKNEMVGHILFSPARIRLMGRTVSALAVAPVSVVPEFQRCGIGGQLLRAGHELGRSEGFALAFLLGHPSYYPRHGYQSCLGAVNVTIDVDRLPEPDVPLRPMPVHPADIPWLVERFAAEWDDVDFSWRRGNSLTEWTLCGTNALIWWTDDGHRAAYTLGWPRRRGWQMVLAEEPELAREALAMIRPKKLRQHPAGWLAQHALDPEWGRADVKRDPAGMVCELETGALEPYLRAIEDGDRAPGYCTWPLSFMTC